jgi:hypothetical protein
MLAHRIGRRRAFILSILVYTLVERVSTKYGRIDGLFNNAGAGLGGTAESTSEDDWAQVVALNVTAVWRMCKAVIPVDNVIGMPHTGTLDRLCATACL